MECTAVLDDQQMSASRTFAKDHVNDHLLLLAHCWVLAGKYLLPKLQNLVMMELIMSFDRQQLPDDSELVKALLRTSPVGSPLRRLISEETIINMYERRFGSKAHNRLQSSDLTASDGATGVSGSLLDAFKAYMDNDRCKFFRIETCEDVETTEYREYLVGADIGKSWSSNQEEPEIVQGK